MDENEKNDSNEAQEKLDFYKETIEDFRRIIEMFDTEKERLLQVIKSINEKASHMPFIFQKMCDMPEDKSLPPAREMEPIQHEEEPDKEMTKEQKQIEKARNLMSDYGELVRAKKRDYDDLKAVYDERLSEISRLPSFIRNRFFDKDINELVESNNRDLHKKELIKGKSHTEREK